jgi:lysophospholipase L1-like esterase
MAALGGAFVALLMTNCLSSPSIGADLPPTRIVLAGDSTVTDTAGWGKAFALELRPEAECHNTSVGGTSTKSFRDKGLWEKALALHPNYIFIQFGHNDMPGKGPDRETDPNTTYKENLARFIDEARAIGAKPILVTSLARRTFDKEGKLIDALAPYAEAAKAVAVEKNVPLIDLHARSLELVQKLGPVESLDLGPILTTGPYTGKRDITHLSPKGAEITAQLVIEELRVKDPEVAAYLKP